MNMVFLPFAACLVIFSTACSPAGTSAAVTEPGSVSLPPTQTEMPTPVPSGPCDNPLSPLAAGNEWIYQSSSAAGSTRQQVVVTGLDNDQATLEMTDPGTGETIQEIVFCDQGNIKNFPVLFHSLHLSDYMDGVFNTYRIEGLYAPSYSVLEQNAWIYSWETIYITESNVIIEQPDMGVGLMILQNNRMNYEWSVENVRESVTVPAGTFPQALKVVLSWKISVTLTGLGGTEYEGMGASLVIETEQWYEPFVGLLKSQVTSSKIVMSGGSETPYLIDSVIELMSFTHGE